ncbi:MAG: hypothetical protein ACT4N2_14770 [Hyphomicrobium sp.]
MIHPTETADDGDPTLGAKVAHLIGLTSYKFALEHPLDKNIASYIGVADATWSRMKVGNPQPDPAKLGRLARYFRLDADRLDYEVFREPTLGDFKATLKRHRVGAHGASDDDYARKVLRTARNVRANGIAIEKIRAQPRGLCRTDTTRPDVVTLCLGSAATVKIAHPEGGHLLVLSDRPDHVVECLVPSCLAPSTEVRGRATRIPTDDGCQPVLDVRQPTGRHRLYSIWTNTPLRAAILEGIDVENPTTQALTTSGFRQLAALIERLDSTEPPPEFAPDYEIRIADYLVVA